MGGGGSMGSGAVSYPMYIEAEHWNWITDHGAVAADKVWMTCYNDALIANPYDTATAYDPSADIAEWIAELGVYTTLEALYLASVDLDPSTTIPTVSTTLAVPTAITEAEITASGAALEANLAAQENLRLLSNILPQFEGGMRDVNAVLSSAFVVGRAIIEDEADLEITRQVAKHESDLRVKTRATDKEVFESGLRKIDINIKNAELVLKGIELSLKDAAEKLNSTKAMAELTLEANRVKIVALKEESDRNLEIDSRFGLWEMDLWQYGANMLAAPAGGTALPGTNKPSIVASAIGGALSMGAAGAQAGGQIGGGYGAIAGGVLGVGAGVGQAFIE